MNTEIEYPKPIISFFVEGIPGPGGSKNAFAFRRKNGSLGANVVDAGGKKTKNWRKAVSWTGKEAWGGRDLLTSALSCSFHFRIKRPKCHYGSKKGIPYLKPDAPKYPISPADVLKLTRSTEDALKGIIYVDDSIICKESISKSYGDTPGCTITIEEMK